MSNAKVVLEQTVKKSVEYGTDIGKLTNKFYFEKFESQQLKMNYH